MAKPCCKTCRWWDMHSLSLIKGDCRVPGDHRYSRVLMTDRKGNHSYAMLDSFGREETLPGFVCGAWADGETATTTAT